jgi:hypothetical protein
MALGAALALPVLASAQTAPFRVDAESASGAAKEQVGGTTAMDLITLRAGGPGVPLKNGAVISGSERVELDGRVLRRGHDYNVDYTAGVIYLMVAQREGQILRVAYRYDKAAPKLPSQQFAGLAPFRFDLVPGGMSMIVGMGLTERMADGTVLSSNIYGVNNSLSFGNSELSGLMMVGDRSKVDVQSNFSPEGDKKQHEQGSSRLILQNLQTNVGGGTIKLNYQETSDNFTGFSAARGSVDDKVVDQLQKERGMRRFGFEMRDVDLGGIKVNNNFRNVRDGNDGIEWREFGIATGAMEINYRSQKVGEEFKRFKDLAEGDREQLMREKGLSRENFAAKFNADMGRFGFEQSRISDTQGNAVRQQQVALNIDKIEFLLKEQEMDEGFNRFNNLLEKESIFGQDRAQWGREAGLKRQELSLVASLFGSTADPIRFSQSFVGTKDGRFTSTEFRGAVSGWSLEHSARSVDQDFKRLNSLAQGEIDEHIKTVASMYGNGAQFHPNERGLFLRSEGISRELTRIKGEPFKSWQFEASRLQLRGADGGGAIETLNFTSKDLQFNYRRQNLSDQFAEFNNLMNFERQQLGQIAGLDRMDWSLNARIGKNGAFKVAQTNAGVGEDTLSRNSIAYADTRLQVSASTREVDPGFANLNHLVDPERDLLNALRGFKQRDFQLDWEILPGLKMNAFQFHASNEELEEIRMMQNFGLSWKPNKGTDFAYIRHERRDDDPLNVLFAHTLERLSLRHDFGRLGRVAYLEEKLSFDGERINRPDSKKQYFAYETQLDNKTFVKTEQTRVRFDDGGKEDVSANTIGTELSDRVGIAITEVQVSRGSDERDETKRNYGFWFDLGNGFRISYGYQRHLNGEAGTLTSAIAIGQGPAELRPDKIGNQKAASVAGFEVAGGYGTNRWDEQRTQSFSNFRLSNPKPMAFLGLRDLKFDIAFDTVADRSVWLREDRFAKIDGKLGENRFGLMYRSQVDKTGARGVDRGFLLATPNDKNRPFVAELAYKLRTLPNSEQYVMRNFNVAFRPVKNFELVHQLAMNPEDESRRDAFLGSIIRHVDRSNLWQLEYTPSQDFKIAGSWKELINDRAQTLSRVGGVTVTFFEKLGSPLTFFYGVEQRDWANRDRLTEHRYYLRYDQTPGPNQVLSLFAGNVSYEHSIADGKSRQNWSLRFDYQLKFNF